MNTRTEYTGTRRRSAKLLLALLAVMPSVCHAQYEGIRWARLKQAQQQSAQLVLYSPNNNTTLDSVWTYLKLHHTFDDTPVYFAQKINGRTLASLTTGPWTQVDFFSVTSDSLWQYTVAGATFPQTPDSGKFWMSRGPVLAPAWETASGGAVDSVRASHISDTSKVVSHLDVLDSAKKTAVAVLAYSADSAIFADSAGKAHYSDTAKVTHYADTALTAHQADTAFHVPGGVVDSVRAAHIADTATSAYTATNLLGTVAQTISLATGTCGMGGTGVTAGVTLSTTTNGTGSQRISSSPGYWATEEWEPFSTSAPVSFGWFSGIFNASTLSNCTGSSASNYNPAWHLQVYGSGFYGSAARDLMVVMPYNSLGSYGVLAFPNDGGYGIGSIVGPSGTTFTFQEGSTNLAITSNAGGTNGAGGSYINTIAPGTGTGTPGAFIIKGSYKTTSGSSAQTARTILNVASTGTDATNSAITTLTVGSSLITGVGGVVIVPDTVKANNAGITIPGATIVKIEHGSETGAFAITLPSGTDGQMLFVYNNTSFATTGTVISAGTIAKFLYLDGAWVSY